MTDSQKKVTPPVAQKIPKELQIHGDLRVDNYYWLNQRENPEVIKYLEQENSYYESMTSHIKKFQEDLFEEMKSRIKEEDESVPYKKNGYYYITRFKTGQQYPIYSRKKDNLEALEELIVDVNEMAEGHDYYALTGLNISPNNKLAAFGVDTFSRRQYDLRFKNLETMELYPEKIRNTTGSSAWASDNRTVFYTRKDPVTLRSDKIYRHTVGTDPSEDTLIYQEDDETFWTFVYRSKSGQYIIIGSYSTLTTEYRFLRTDDPLGEFSLIQKRQRGLEYSIAHFEDKFYIH
jgi:oligopeptidase B